MRRTLLAGLAIALLLAPPVVGASYEAEAIDAGADLTLHLSYDGGTTGQRAGTLKEPDHTRQWNVRTSSHAAWDGTVDLRNPGGRDALQGNPMWGQFLASVKVSADRAGTSTFQSEGMSSESTETCHTEGSRVLGTQVKAWPEPTGLRVKLEFAQAADYFFDKDACRHKTVERPKDSPASTTETTTDFQPTVATFHALTSGNAGNTASETTVFIPYGARSVVDLASSWPVPHDYESPALLYCAMPAPDDHEWAPGTCTASGTLTVTAFIHPCGAIERHHREHHDALLNYPRLSPGASETDIRTWSARATALIRDVISNQRDWSMMCSGDLQPDPWEAMLRIMQEQRDALLELGKQDQLSDEGLRELLAAERQVQMMGGKEADFSQVPAWARATRSPPGTMQVSVHSPVSLHVYDEKGGHVGWDTKTNTSESTINGATYSGAPGGAQTITLPAGYYKIVVDELEAGKYLLSIETNGTGADTNESFLGDSRAGRTTSTHSAVTDGWEGPRLDAFPLRRADTPASITFRDEGRPSMTGGATVKPANPWDAPSTGAAGTAGDAGTGKGIPAPALGLVLLGLGAAAWRRRRRD